MIWALAGAMLGLLWGLGKCLDELRALNVRTQDLVENSCKLIEQLDRIAAEVSRIEESTSQ